MSPAVFAIALAPRLEELERRLRDRDPHAKVLAYLDDVYVVIDAASAQFAVEALQQLAASLTMELRVDKT